MQITCNTLGAYHVQHVVHHMVGKDSSAPKLERVDTAFILAVFHWLKPLTSEEYAH